MIATVLSFACFSVRQTGHGDRGLHANEMQHFDQDWESYEMHMEGLLTIIRIRGGANAINHNRILRLLLSGYG